MINTRITESYATNTPRTQEEIRELRATAAESHRFRLNPRRIGAGALVLLTTGLAAAGALKGAEVLDKTNERFTPTDATSKVYLGRAIISASPERQVYVREDPHMYDPESTGSNNKCAAITEDTQLTTHFGGRAFLQERPHNANGPVYGIPLGNMPFDIQEKCSEDRDGLVWIVANKVTPGQID